MNLEHVNNVIVQHKLMLPDEVSPKVRDRFLGVLHFVGAEAKAAAQPWYFMPFDKVVGMACETVHHVNLSNRDLLHEQDLHDLMQLIQNFIDDILENCSSDA